MKCLNPGIAIRFMSSIIIHIFELGDSFHTTSPRIATDDVIDSIRFFCPAQLELFNVDNLFGLLLGERGTLGPIRQGAATKNAYFSLLRTLRSSASMYRTSR